MSQKDKSTSNAEVQTSKRTSTINKSIKRTLQTAAYESIVIEESIEETIEWSNLDERNKKENNWTTVLIDQFKRAHDKVMGELGLEEKKAYFKSTNAKTAEKYAKNANSTSSNSGNIDLDDLDELG